MNPWITVHHHVFSNDGLPDDYKRRHPLARIPAFEHNGFCLYETGAITRYIDETFTTPALLPNTIEGRARVNQIISILDSYAYRAWVWDIYVEEDANRVATALPKAETCLSAIEELMSGESYFMGQDVTLADLYALPMITCLQQKTEGREVLEKHPRWIKWLASVSERPGAAMTLP